jgi:predicted O-methyltransferase YrrM
VTQTVPEHDWTDASSRVNAVLAPTRMHLANAIKTVAYHTGMHRTLFYRYDYMFRPRDLALLTTLLTKTSRLKGPILEIGCAAGHTTVFLNKHLDDLQDRRRYLCLDTFAGFTNADIQVEVERGHRTSQYEYVFRAYRKQWFDQTMRNNHIARVTSIQADVNTFDFSPYRNISFCLIDVDLTRPVSRALQEIYPLMAPGGVVVVDDCNPDQKYEGAGAAYVDFVGRCGAPVDIRNDVLGIIRVPAGVDERDVSTNGTSGRDH